MDEVRLSVDQATAIISEAKNDGSYSDPMPVDEHERVAEATSIYQQAVNAAKNDVKIDAVYRIIAIAHGEDAPFDVPEPETEAVEEASEEPAEKQELDFVMEEPAEEAPKPAKKTKKPAPKQEDQRMQIDDFFAKERLPIPASPDWEVTPVPADLTTLSDVEMRRMHGQYHAYYVRAAYLLAQEENDLSVAEHMHETSLAKAIRDIGGDKITAAKTEAALAPEVLKWKEKVLEHSAAVKQLKALAAIYDSTCNRLSREWTMRSDERSTSGNLFSNR